MNVTNDSLTSANWQRGVLLFSVTHEVNYPIILLDIIQFIFSVHLPPVETTIPITSM